MYPGGSFLFQLNPRLDHRLLVLLLRWAGGAGANPSGAPERERLGIVRRLWHRNRRTRGTSGILEVEQPQLSWFESLMKRSERRRAKRVASQDMPTTLAVATTAAAIARDESHLSTTILAALRGEPYGVEIVAPFRFCECTRCQAAPWAFLDMP
jgi:hypothetical protein